MGKLRSAVIGFVLIAVVVIGFVALIAIATPGEPPEIPATGETVPEGTQTRNETIPAALLAITPLAEPESEPEANATQPAANETIVPEKLGIPTDGDDPLDIFDVSPEAITAAVVQFMKEVFDFGTGDTGTFLGFLFDIFSDFTDPDGGWHG